MSPDEIWELADEDRPGIRMALHKFSGGHNMFWLTVGSASLAIQPEDLWYVRDLVDAAITAEDQDQDD